MLLKKIVAGILAVISTVVSIVLWFYFASLPSFNDCKKGFDELKTETFKVKELPK